MRKPSKKVTLRFFDFKWKKVPHWARETDAIYRKWYLRRYGYGTLTALREFLADKRRILDAGCGLGRDSKMFAECNPHAEIIAMDRSSTAVRVARHTLQPLKNCRVVKADITCFRYPGLFDFISCDQVLHHTPDPAKTLGHLYGHLTPGGVFNFFVCRKKNPRRDLVDDRIMDYARTASPRQLWAFAEVVTRFGEALYKLNIRNVPFGNKTYDNIQRFVHNHLFRCWYNPDIDFALSVSSNFDWFSGNPRFDGREVRETMERGLGPHRILRFYEDDASVSVSIRKL